MAQFATEEYINDVKDTVVSAACEEHRQPVFQRLCELAWEPVHPASGVDPYEEPRDLPWASPGLGRALTPDEHMALLKERNAKAREAINALVAENAQLRAAGPVNDDPMSHRDSR